LATAANRGGQAKLGTTNGHVGILAAVLGDQSGNVMGKNPVVSGVGTFN